MSGRKRDEATAPPPPPPWAKWVAWACWRCGARAGVRCQNYKGRNKQTCEARKAGPGAAQLPAQLPDQLPAAGAGAARRELTQGELFA